MAVTRRLAVYRTVAPDEAVFAGWDDEIDRGDDEIATELWASDSDEIAASAACDDTMDGTEIVLHLVRREWARV